MLKIFQCFFVKLQVDISPCVFHIKNFTNPPFLLSPVQILCLDEAPR